MTIDQLLIEIRRVAEAGDPDSPAIRRKLVALVNKAGAAELLIGVLRTGEPFAAEVAALALPHARSELVRHALRVEARRSTGQRSLSFLAALTPEELAAVMKERGGVAASEFVEAAGLLAVNSPREFVEMLCDGATVVDLPMIEHVELVRRTFAIGPVALYGPLLDRRLSPEARRRTIGILGRESGEEVKRLLERTQARATDADDRKALRREQLRQATLTASGEVRAPRRGLAVLTPLIGTLGHGLELFEELDDGRVLHSIVRFGPRGAIEAITAPSDGDLETCAARAEPAGAPRITLGQARAYLEGLPSARRARVAALLDRLQDIPAEALSGPQPTGTLSAEQARELVASPLWRAWRPLRPWVDWPDGALDAVRELPAELFPGPYEEMLVLARFDVAALLGRRGAASVLSAGLRHMALVLQLAGDARAPGVAAEAARVARRRAGPITTALAERERWRELWASAPLPEAYRSLLRDHLRPLIDGHAPDWPRVRLLDLAQAVAEGLARGRGERETSPGLPPVAEIDFESALKLARGAANALVDPDLQRRVRAGQLEIVAETARSWLDDAPTLALVQIVELIGDTCFGRCPHRCFDGEPKAAPAEVFEGESPPAP